MVWSKQARDAAAKTRGAAKKRSAFLKSGNWVGGTKQATPRKANKGSFKPKAKSTPAAPQHAASAGQSVKPKNESSYTGPSGTKMHVFGGKASSYFGPEHTKKAEEFYSKKTSTPNHTTPQAGKKTPAATISPASGNKPGAKPPTAKLISRDQHNQAAKTISKVTASTQKHTFKVRHKASGRKFNVTVKGASRNEAMYKATTKLAGKITARMDAHIKANPAKGPGKAPITPKPAGTAPKPPMAKLISRDNGPKPSFARRAGAAVGGAFKALKTGRTASGMKTGSNTHLRSIGAKVGGFVKKKLGIHERGTIMQWSDEARQLAANATANYGKRGMKKGVRRNQGGLGKSYAADDYHSLVKKQSKVGWHGLSDKEKKVLSDESMLRGFRGNARDMASLPRMKKSSQRSPRYSSSKHVRELIHEVRKGSKTTSRGEVGRAFKGRGGVPGANAKQSKLGSGGRFKALKDKLGGEGVNDPAAVAASIGRKKYGEKKMAKLSAGGRASNNAKRHKVSVPPSNNY